MCHAYQIVHAHGVPDDHIIVMMYDDIAYAKENPTPGKIINHPNGTDVYKGVPKDYVCSTVRPDVFLKVNGKRLKTFGVKIFSQIRFLKEKKWKTLGLGKLWPQAQMTMCLYTLQIMEQR